ncbi:MAG TPA: hypothetical protein VHU83_21345 [Bryobacteraceae bacterium]|jgi:hypothetical protein|nr:hypothetical protein [Bryobacteraceae bacterium]
MNRSLPLTALALVNGLLLFAHGAQKSTATDPAATGPIDFLPSAVVGRPYSVVLPVAGSAATCTKGKDWASTAPPGLEVRDCVLSGEIAADADAKLYRFQIQANGKDGWFQLKVVKDICEGQTIAGSAWCFPFSSVPEPLPRSIVKLSGEQLGFVENFDRPENQFYKAPPLRSAPALDPQLEAAAVLGSKVLTTGSLVVVQNVAHCARYDWKIVVQSVLSFNQILYGPTDITTYCAEDESNLDLPADLYVVLPVQIAGSGATPDRKNVSLTGYYANTADSMRKAPTPLIAKNSVDCLGQPAGPIPPQNILPCDAPGNKAPGARPGTPFVPFFYRTRWLYDRFTAPGTAQGSISFTPVIGNGSQSFINDIVFNPSTKLGYGWLSLPLMFEKNTTAAKADFDSLTGGLAYSMKFGSQSDPWQPLAFQPIELILETGPEFATTRPYRELIPTPGRSRARDLNYLDSLTLRFPFAFTFSQQPSALTFFPTVMAEGGSHLVTHLAEPETDPIYRTSVGMDASFRSPWLALHNFAGDKPATIDYSYRTSFLAFPEPYEDPSVISPLTMTPNEALTRQRRSYTRISYNVPFSTYFGLKVTVQKGSLPPDFHTLGYTLTVGVTLLNPGISEH